jgi:ankyrin repeat protein
MLNRVVLWRTNMVEIKNVNRPVTINPIENNEEMQEASSSAGPQAPDQNVDQTVSALKKQSTESRSMQELQGKMQGRALEDQLNRKLPGQNPGVLQYQTGQIVPTNAQGQPLTRAQIQIDQLADAADKGDIVKLKQLIAAGVDVNGKESSSFGETALMQAARRGNIAVIDELMQHGARVDEKATNGQTALMQASMAVGGEKAVHHLIHQFKADVDVQDTAGRTALMMTAIGNSPKAMEELLNANAKTNMLDGDPSTNSQPGQNALMYAAERGNKECMELLMKAGVDVDMVSRTGKTAVYLAASRGQAEAIELLIKANANPNVPGLDPDKRTPLMIAASGGHHQAVKTLVANSAALDERDPVDSTAVFEAVTNHHHESLKALLDAHADPNVPITIRKGWTPLMDAAREGDLKSVQLLIQAGAKQDLKNGDGETARTVAQNALKFRTDLTNDDRKNLSAIIQLLQTPSKTP